MEQKFLDFCIAFVQELQKYSASGQWACEHSNLAL